MTFLIDPMNPSDVCGTCKKKGTCMPNVIYILAPIIPPID